MKKLTADNADLRGLDLRGYPLASLGRKEEAFSLLAFGFWAKTSSLWGERG